MSRSSLVKRLGNLLRPRAQRPRCDLRPAIEGVRYGAKSILQKTFFEETPILEESGEISIVSQKWREVHYLRPSDSDIEPQVFILRFPEPILDRDEWTRMYAGWARLDKQQRESSAPAVMCDEKPERRPHECHESNPTESHGTEPNTDGPEPPAIDEARGRRIRHIHLPE
jgi:hypothetical protein